MKEDLRIEWEAIGLLEGISEDRKEKVIHALNLTINWINERYANIDESGQFETLPIIVIRRIVKEIDVTDDEVLEIGKEVKQAHDNYDFNKFNYVGGNTIDYEAEFVGEFCDNKINQLKK